MSVMSSTLVQASGNQTIHNEQPCKPHESDSLRKLPDHIYHDPTFLHTAQQHLKAVALSAKARLRTLMRSTRSKRHQPELDTTITTTTTTTCAPEAALAAAHDTPGMAASDPKPPSAPTYSPTGSNTTAPGNNITDTTPPASTPYAFSNPTPNKYTYPGLLDHLPTSSSSSSVGATTNPGPSGATTHPGPLTAPNPILGLLGDFDVVMALKDVNHTIPGPTDNIHSAPDRTTNDLTVPGPTDNIYSAPHPTANDSTVLATTGSNHHNCLAPTGNTHPPLSPTGKPNRVRATTPPSSTAAVPASAAENHGPTAAVTSGAATPGAALSTLRGDHALPPALERQAEITSACDHMGGTTCCSPVQHGGEGVRPVEAVAPGLMTTTAPSSTSSVLGVTAAVALGVGVPTNSKSEVHLLSLAPAAGSEGGEEVAQDVQRPTKQQALWRRWLPSCMRPIQY